VHVIATAGHVDHGKSTLVQALTGQEPDRLAEEKRRGLSIRLGYCWARLEPVGDVAFVDVPGHERFLATTLSGLGPVPAVMFVVAADDPWMPQAAEHLAALDALDVRHGVLVVTRADLAAPGPTLDEARRQLARTSLAGAPSVTVSGRTGAGLDDLRRALADMVGALPVPDPDAPVRLWADRRFHVHGAGTVVTGTLPAGTIRVGDQLACGDVLVRVRHLQTLGRQVDRVSGAARVALDLGGRVPGQVDHDSVFVTPGAFAMTTQFDAHLRGDGAPPERPLLHVGALVSAAHARPLAAGFVRLSLDRPLPLRHGDRAVLRDPGSRRLWGVRVLDPDPPELGRRGAAARQAAGLGTFDGGMAAAVRLHGRARRSELARQGFRDDVATASPRPLVAGDWLLAPERGEVLSAQLHQVVAASADGITPVAAAQAMGLPDPSLVLPLVTAPLSVVNGRIVVASGPDPTDQRALAALRSLLEEHPFAAPDAAGLEQLGIDDGSLVRLARAGLVLRLAPGTALLPAAVDLAMARLAVLPQPFTASQARAALDTSRRVALPLLAHLDRTGGTLRLPDDRRRLRATARVQAH